MTFDPAKHYSTVFQQQGRVQMDADSNEGQDILRYFSRRLAADLIGPHGGTRDGFRIDPAARDQNNNEVLRDFDIAPGHYYVDGILCENDGPTRYSAQSGSPIGLDKLEVGKLYLAYLDVWERHVTAYEDENEERIGIREVALRGPDTGTRAQIIWQVKWKLIDQSFIDKLKAPEPEGYKNFLTFLQEQAPPRGRLRARALKPRDDDEPCIISPEAHYRGAENQLYRVEIHRPGVGMPPTDTPGKPPKVDINKIANFKWSRENGSVIFPITDVQGEVVTLRDLGRESRFGLRVDDWVEITDDDYVLQNRAEPLLQVKTINRDTMEVTLKTAPASPVGTDAAKHPLMRRWDQKSDAIAVVQTTGDDDPNWIFKLEDGVQIQFPRGEGNAIAPASSSSYRTGDYWLIPARVATGDVEWPGPRGNPRPRAPHGVEHAFAPLGVIAIAAGGKVTPTAGGDLRKIIKPLTS
ncbi:MAG TPA: hypothetical protein DC047_08385 [Blastocatellia bacterium]|nr:hypothetical protein [Blastocatellia bacterium]